MTEARYVQQYGRILQPWISSIVEQEISNAIDRMYVLLALSEKGNKGVNNEYQIPLFPRNLGPRNPYRSRVEAEKNPVAVIEKLNKVLNWPELSLNKRVLVRQVPGSINSSEKGLAMITLSDGKHCALGVIFIKDGKNSAQSQQELVFSSTQDTVVIIRNASINLSSPLLSNANTKVCEIRFIIREYVSIRYPRFLASTYDPCDLSRFDQQIWQLVRLTMYGIPCNPRWKDISFPITRVESCIPKDQMRILGYRIRSQRSRKSKHSSFGATRVLSGKLQLQHNSHSQKALSFKLRDVLHFGALLYGSPVYVSKYSICVRVQSESYQSVYFKWFVLPSVRMCLLSTLSTLRASAPTIDISTPSFKRLRLDSVICTPSRPVNTLPEPRKRRPNNSRTARLLPTSFAKVTRTYTRLPAFNYVPPGKKWRSHDTLGFISSGLALWIEGNGSDHLERGSEK